MAKASAELEATLLAFWSRWGELIARPLPDSVATIVDTMLCDDVDYTMPDAPPMRGKAAVGSYLQHSRARMQAMGGVKQTGFTAQFLVDPGVAEPAMVVCIGRQELEFAGQACVSNGSSTFVKVEGEWKLRVISTSNPTPAFIKGLLQPPQSQS